MAGPLHWSRWLVTSTLKTCIVLVGITFISFSLLHFSPGNPAEIWLYGGDGNVGQVSDRALAALEAKMGLDKPFPIQYLNWLGRLLHGDLGTSITTGRPVVLELSDRILPTLKLAGLSLGITLLVSIPLGLYCASQKDGRIDNLARVFSFFGISMPSFLVSLLLLYVFCIRLGWFSVVAKPGISGIVMPVAVLTFQCTAKFTRQIRAVVLEEMNRDYVTGAEAFGISRHRILFSYVLHNAMLPIVTWIGIYFGILLGGAAIVESIFSLPGLGKLAVDAVARRDYFVIQGFVLWAAATYLIVNFMVDFSYSLLDPRVARKTGSKR